MIYADTNVFIRLITNDSPELKKRAVEFIESSPRNSVIVDTAVFAEIAFVLEFHEYKMKRSDIADAMLDIIDMPCVVEEQNIAFAVRLFKENPKLDFTDTLLIAFSGGKVMSFDKELLKAAEKV